MGLFWLEQTQEDAPPGDEWLSVEERRALERLRVPKRRADWRLGRWTAKNAIAALRPEAADLAEIEVRPTEGGAPSALLCGRPSGLRISLSHSRGRGFCALAEGIVAIGCDLEWIEPRSPEFVEEYFTRREQAMVAAGCAGARAGIANLLWSAKESALKALGAGLRMDPRSVSVVAAGVGASSGGWLELRASAEPGGVFHGWWRAEDGFVRTVLCRPRPSLLLELDSAPALRRGAATILTGG